MQQPSDATAPATPPGVLVLGERAMSWLQRGVWIICIGIYLSVFISGIQAGGGELAIMGRAAAFALLAALLGRMMLGLLGRSRLPAVPSPPGVPSPMASEEGTLGSLADLVGSAKVAQHTDDAQAGQA